MRKTIKTHIADTPEEIHFEFVDTAPDKIPVPDIDEYIKSPMENAVEALDNLKSSLSSGNTEDAHIKALAEIKENASAYLKADCPMPNDFIWYKITDIKPLADISCFAHILYNHDVISAFAKHGHYLLGIKDNILCFAIPVEKCMPNPIPHIDDCTVYICPDNMDFEYCTVCVALEKDGQYFMKICPSDR